MGKEKTDNDLQEMFQLIEKIEKADLENTNGFNIIMPYSSGKKPEPVRWEDKGLQHKRA